MTNVTRISKTPATIWSCKIGECHRDAVPSGGDSPMRSAVAVAYRQLTGYEPDFIFSGWGAELTEIERAVVENRMPNEPPDEIERLSSALAARDAEIAELRQDAERYRWLRERLQAKSLEALTGRKRLGLMVRVGRSYFDSTPVVPPTERDRQREQDRSVELDAAIDLAIRGEKPE